MSILAEYTCTRCGKTKPIAEFTKHKQAKSGYCYCTKCNRAASKAVTDALKLEVIGAYGGRCLKCGEADIDVLTIDHIDQRGSEHKQQNKLASGGPMYRWLRANKYPDNFRVLCFNCNTKAYLVWLRTKELT